MRRESHLAWTDLAKRTGQKQFSRPGKNVWIGKTSVGLDGKALPYPIVFEVAERTTKKQEAKTMPRIQIVEIIFLMGKSLILTKTKNRKRRIKRMVRHNGIFSQAVSLINRNIFNRLVKRHMFQIFTRMITVHPTKLETSEYSKDDTANS